MKLEIEKAFLTEGRNIYDFFQRPGVGFYIPLYQREYSWDKDNVEQLIEDIEKGVSALVEVDGETEIRFLGTIITVIEKDKKRIQPLDPQALPTAVEKLIDGQQRLSTISLIGAFLYKYFHNIQISIPENSVIKNELNEICQFWKDRLIDIFSFDLKRGTPQRKPKIIRGYIDEWTKEGEVDEKYKSEISNYLGKFISAVEFNKDFPDIPKEKSNFTINAKIIDNWLKKITLPTEQEDETIPHAWEMLKRQENHEFIWSYYREELENIVNEKELKNKKSDSYITSSIVQLISISHYLLERCCFTIIQPINEDWAFDMFQSLNASGTPLTAIETFKPLVVNTTEFNNEKYENSLSKRSFTKIEELFKESNNAATKSKLTNEFLTSLAIVLNGSKLESHFSSQRKYLERIYSQTLSDYKHQCNLINFIGNYAEFYKNIWIDYKGTNNLPITEINSNTNADIASLLILFLKRSNHRMAITILGSFYNEVLNGKDNSIVNFIEAVKVIAAFYILWRSCDSNAGLDNVYRNYFKGKDNEITAQNWITKNNNLDLIELKKYLKNNLVNKGIIDKSKWIVKSKNYLRYDNSATVCRISLILAADDTVVDKSKPGLMKAGIKNSSPYLNLLKWNSDDLKDIEHIAPQNNNGEWDKSLYDINSKLYDTIGNLTLLPSVINISASNKGWREKLIYYQHLGTKDPDTLKELAVKAKKEGFILSEPTIKLLENANYNEHILPILSVNEQNEWNEKIVTQRSERILEIVWDKVYTWLN